MVARRWVTTGQQERIDPGPQHARLPEWDPRTGDHFWSVITTYRVNPRQWADPNALPVLDHESLINITPVFCLHCEQTYTERLGNRRCTGEPTITKGMT